MLIPGARRPRALLLAILLAAPAAAQGAPSLVRRQGPARVSVPPGRSVTAVFLVSPSSPAGATVYAEVEAPEGWRTVAGGGSLRLGPGERRTQLVSVVVPAAAGPGAYT
ncbi:MAG TPA: NEW3 domain-containing protein, partial [Longimicrobiaceae bacterium]|nr:NEW3 domain-containing protein [Longimicrobiaceae bacterium]